MIIFKTGNLLTEDVEAIVNTVNCVGIMGRGIALQFKKRFPENFKVYAAACKKKAILPGKMFVYKTDSLINPKYIISFPTKRHWRGASRMEDIENGLQDLVKVIKDLKIQSIALPPLGCGLGGLDWNTVRVRIEFVLNELRDVDVVVFEPKGAPTPEEMVKNRKVPKMTPGRAALVELMHRYFLGLLDPFITLLEVHKLMYFLQESGESLRLQYAKAPYGPYAKNLRHVLNAIEGHLIFGYADGEDKPDKQLKLVPGAYEDATRFLNEHKGTKEHYDKVSDLVDGFETPFGMELLSTVHWVITKESAHSFSELITKVYDWNKRKKQFSQRQIQLAVKVLEQKKWINITNWSEV